MSQDDEERRRQEISMFAKLASGDTFQAVPPAEEKESSMDSKAMFAAAAQEPAAGGTFCVSSSPNTHKAAASSNLDAAVAALTNGDDPLELLETEDDLSDEVNLRRAQLRQPTEPMPMYNEKVLLPRPLFFGPVLPPRVIKETRTIVADTMKELNLDLSKRPRLSQLPPHVRNVVGAIEAFGYGIPIFPSDIKEGDKDSYRGTEYVSTFQPVWGDVARAERERLLRIYRASQPEEELSPASGESTREESITPTEAGQNMVKEVLSIDANLRRSFPGDVPQNIQGSTSFPERASPSNSLPKSLLLRSKSAPVAGAKAPKSPHMSENDQFLQWARGKPVSPARHGSGKPSSLKKSVPNEKELFSQWARGKSASPELDIVKARSDSDTATDKDLFSKWAQGNLEQSPVVTEGRKVDTMDGAGSDVAMFSKWAKGGVDESPAKMTDEADDDTNRASAASSGSSVDKNQFSRWAQGGGASPEGTPSQTIGKTAREADSAQTEKDLFSKWATRESNSDPSRSSPESGESDKGNSSLATDDKPPPSEQNVFSQWARAGQGETGTRDSSSASKNEIQRPFDTFCAVPDSAVDDFSDDDSVDRSELKKKVGMNENINSALASLANEAGRSMPVGTDSIGAEEADELMAQIGATTEGGRPLTNFEITNGLVPLFGCDDSPLPGESDLGIFQTKEEQNRSIEQRRSQEIIDKHTYPNIFGPVACPNPANGPDDSHSWNSRNVPSRRHVAPPVAAGHQTSGPGIVPVLDSPVKPKNKQGGKQSPASIDSAADHRERSRSIDTATPSAYSTSSMSRDGTSRRQRKAKSRGVTSFDANARFGWWSDSEEGTAKDNDNDEPSLVQLPHTEYGSPATRVATGLTPTPEFLRKENMPLSELHSATSVAETLPFLSDRPPSFRYLQIDTEAVGFPSVGGEIEPLFCSLAIYHVEATTSSHDPRAAPVPNMQRCGRVTEVLTFDAVRDPEVEAACSGCLWPYAKHAGNSVISAQAQSTQGSRCGVFPIASNHNVAKLYAILIVHKVLSDTEDADVYTKSSRVDSKGVALPVSVDMGKLREKAAKASSRQGDFLMPFAFGVAPLLQIFGTDIPTTVSSRAVQIPLFKFKNGYGDRPIIDHIMVMLYPRADHRTSGLSGPAPLTNSGTAMLVMRNFGYLGLHQAVFSKSSLRARDRLVDFSGELQVRREIKTGDVDNEIDSSPHIVDDRTYVVAPWHNEFVSEPTIDGGRNSALTKTPSVSCESGIEQKSRPEELGSSVTPSSGDKAKSRFYAKEMAPVPLSPLKQTPPTGKAVGNGRGRSGRGGRSVNREMDIEPTFHTTFCNELLCHPRLLHKSPKGNIAIKVELREIEWSPLHQTHMASLPKFGPSMHNPRRGPFLVQNAFTACSFQAVNAHFLDEFKIKLPLLLEGKAVGGGLSSGPLALFFTVYKVGIKPKRGWSVSTPRKGQSGLNTNGDAPDRKSCRLRLLSCGFLPITTSDTSCLIDNGLHDVKLIYTPEKCEDDPDRDTLLLSPIADHKGREGTVVTGRAIGDSVDEDDERYALDKDGSFFGSESAPSETATESDITRSETSSGVGLVRSTSKREPMSLQVRVVVHSSIHPQNATLNEFLCRLPDPPTALSIAEVPSSAPWKLNRSDLLQYIATTEVETKLEDASDEIQKLLLYTIDVSRPSFCPPSESSSHFFRIFDQLMRTIVSGSGTPSVLWANPASVIPLRMHAFATLLQVINNMTTYMVRNGCTRLDGKGRWNLTQLGRVIAMAFDEEQLFTVSDKSDGEMFLIDDWNASYIDLSVSSSEHGDDSIGSFGERRSFERETDLMQRPTKPERSEATSSEGSDSSSKDDSFAELVAALKSDIPKVDSESSLPLSDSEPEVPAEESSPEPATENASEHGSNFKIDTKSDFQSNLWAGSAECSSSISPTVSGSVMAQNMIQAYGGGPSNRRKWMTAPTSGLATIREDADPSESEMDESSSNLGAVVTPLSPERTEGKAMDVTDSEMVLRDPVNVPERKKMRVPKVSKKPTEEAEKKEKAATFDSLSFSSLTVPSTDEEILTAGTAFLDTIGKNLGYGSAAGKAMGGEEQRVGQAHHRKTRSRCSIDWTIPQVDVLVGNRDSFEQPQLADEAHLDPPSTLPESDAVIGEATGAEKTTMVTLHEENRNTIRLPNYLDRLVSLGESVGTGRWCAYAYEVIIIQWVALLVDQRRSAENQKQDRSSTDSSNATHATEYPEGSFSDASEGLSEAAMRARGVAIACTPVLLEIVKKSIGWRVHYLHDQAKNADSSYKRKCPPLMCLDDFLLSHLEQLVSIITDACLDSRNFDSWEYRQTCIDVNDSVIRFLRDMFAFLHTEQVNRLILMYLSRFVVRDGKIRQDRDSKIGLRCSWEISKLRLNAVTTLVRFPDFTRVNSLQMHNWSNWSIQAPPHLALDFFSKALKQLESFALPQFSSTNLQDETSTIAIPSLQPHWLAEVVTDICLAGTEHAEQYIQHRAGSLLNELFWSHSQEAKANGTSAAVATMYVPFLRKVLVYSSYLATMPTKHQLRKDILPCVTFVMQCAPDGVTRALWRELCIEAEGKGHDEKYGGVGDLDGAPFRTGGGGGDPTIPSSSVVLEERAEPDIFDMFGLLNLALGTFEFGGSDESLEDENIVDGSDELAVWKKEFLLFMAESNSAKNSFLGQGRMASNDQRSEKSAERRYSTTSSRKWNAHDASLAIIHTSRLIVREMVGMQRQGASNVDIASDDGEEMGSSEPSRSKRTLNFTSADIIIFVRAATSVYLHSLALRQSDIAIVKTLDAAVEIVKIFGIKVFLRAVGETLQHWMRLVSFHCGARRAEVRVQSLEFLWLILRLTWDSYGSFFRVRVPLLSVQFEVMERIVATATARNYREQRRMGIPIQSLPNDCAEASLSPLWRTLDRLHHQSASQNLAFRSALIRLAESMKKLYRAYIAAHALAIVNRARSPLSPSDSAFGESDGQDESSPYLQSRRIVVHRIINASAGYSKQFLGLQRSYSQQATVAHNEAVEDAFLDAAYVFSPTELPMNRVAWLQELAKFHASREKHAEEATCHFNIHVTLRQAARLHYSLWENIPFVAWTLNATDGLHLDGEGPAGEAEDYYDTDFDLEELTVEDPGIFENTLGKQIDKRNSFRRQFYRVANSLRMTNGDPEIGGNKNLFYGVTFPFEYSQAMPKHTLREVEEHLVDEAELAGMLFLDAGIAESSRFAWSLATQIYAEKFNYGKLANAYKQLAAVVSSNVPVIDTNSHALELSHPLGRFYRVWFHGGAPDEINGTEFVYRAAGSIKLDQFGEQLSNVIRGILPENTPIDLVLDDGRPERYGFKPHQRRPLGPTPIEPVKIKVTPLRPLLKRAHQIRGTPEWFYSYIDVAFAQPPSSNGGQRNGGGSSRTRSHGDFPQREILPSHRPKNSSASVFASSGSMSSVGMTRVSDRGGMSTGLLLPTDTREQPSAGEQGQLVGVDKFSFIQPARKDRNRSTRDAWLRNADIADKSLRVTQLQVEQSFPACVARQTVMHRTVFQQSPLEAGIDAVCSWCSVLFRTAVASNGMAVLDAQEDHGIGSAAAKVVAESMYSGKVKEMGLVLLQKDAYVAEQSDGGFMMADYDRLTEAEFARLQLKLARAIVVFMEILHLLIARNRDLLLDVMNARKRGEAMSIASGGYARAPSVGRSTPENMSRHRGHSRGLSSTSGLSGGGYSGEMEGVSRTRDDASASNFSSLQANDKTDKNIAVQSELQRTFIGMAKTLYNPLTAILGEETPRWLKEICKDNYFSSSVYQRHEIEIRMADEIYFYNNDRSNFSSDSGRGENYAPPFQVMSIDSSANSLGYDSTNGSQVSGRSRNSATPRRGRGYSKQSTVSGMTGESSIFHV